MTFSIRSFLLGTGVVAIWLGALVSKSPLVVELAVSGTVLLILLSLALAIWDPRPMQRAFWTGFFVLAFGNLLYAGFFTAYQQTSNQVAGLLMGTPASMTYQPSAYSNVPSYGPPMMTPPPRQVSYYAPDADVDEAPQLKTPPVDLTSDDLQVESPNAYPATAPTAAPTPPTAMPQNPVQFPTALPATSGWAPQPVNTIPASNYYEQREAIRAAIPTLMSLLMGLIGGFVTTWIAGRRQQES